MIVMCLELTLIHGRLVVVVVVFVLFFIVWKETMNVGCLQFADVFSKQIGNFKKNIALILMPFKAE